MNRIGRVAVLVLSLACAVAGIANAGETTYMKTIPLSFIEAGQLASTAKDTMYVTSASDTARTTMIDMGDADWAAIYSSGSVATGYKVARVVFVATKANNGASDTLRFNIERAPGNGLNAPATFATSCASCRADTFFSFNPINVVVTASNSLGSVAVCAPGGTASTPTAGYNNNVFEGAIVTIPNSHAANDGFGLKRFRLVIAGDLSGTTPKLSGVKGFLIYPAKR